MKPHHEYTPVLSCFSRKNVGRSQPWDRRFESRHYATSSVPSQSPCTFVLEMWSVSLSMNENLVKLYIDHTCSVYPGCMLCWAAEKVLMHTGLSCRSSNIMNMYSTLSSFDAKALHFGNPYICRAIPVSLRIIFSLQLVIFFLFLTHLDTIRNIHRTLHENNGRKVQTL